MADDYAGLLIIGDPHLEGRIPGFRKDDYPRVILDKLAWALDYAANNRLLPAILGDLFDKPRDNPNWMLVKLLDLLRGEVLTLYGNHDVHYNPQLTADDSLSILVQAGRLRLVSEQSPWQGTIGGRTILVGGASYRQKIPESFAPGAEAVRPLVVWLTHHDVLIPGYDKGYFRPFAIPGIDLVINGHIHRRLDDVQAGQTLWVTPGNISRRARSDLTREHVPAVLRIDVGADGPRLEYVTVPHRPFDEVFHEQALDAPASEFASAFVAGLAELQSRRTASGAGLMQFLQQNLGQFEPAVAREIERLATEVTSDGENASQGN
ncbi:MAG: metallophosphoesterase [Pirellulaceae bacterium]|nr:metallophosphoesterase [Pirellulaceae bacterium]